MSDLDRAGGLQRQLWDAIDYWRVLNDQKPRDERLPGGSVSLQSVGDGDGALRVEYSSKSTGRCANVRVLDPDTLATVKGLAAGELERKIDDLKSRLVALGVDPDA